MNIAQATTSGTNICLGALTLSRVSDPVTGASCVDNGSFFFWPA
jgi:hypothetical protein